jgi:hypothetical protein
VLIKSKLLRDLKLLLVCLTLPALGLSFPYAIAYLVKHYNIFAVDITLVLLAAIFLFVCRKLICGDKY